MKNIIQNRKSLLTSLVIIITCIAFYGLGCGGKKEAETTTGDEAAVDTTAPGISEVTPADRSTISNSASIVIKFVESMDTSSLVLGGTLASASDGGAWAMTTSENDTLTIKPKTNWPISTGTLTISVNAIAGSSSSTTSTAKEATSYNMTFGVQLMYVKQGASGDGTMDSALGDIQSAVEQAANNLSAGIWATSAQVYVAKGTYEVNSGTNHIVMKEGVSIYGGYSDTDWTVRDISANTTTIKDKSSTGGASTAPNRAIEAGSGISIATVIDGFNIEGGSGTGATSAIFNHDGASPTISNNVINGGTGSGEISGIHNRVSSSPLIHHNTIDGGPAEYSFGIANYAASAPSIHDNTITAEGLAGKKGCSGIRNENSSPTIFNNTISGGASDMSSGIENEKSSPKIYNNTINGGSGQESIGIFNDNDSSALIYNNTIDGGSGSSKSTGIMCSDSKPTIDNNIIFTSAGSNDYGIYESTANSNPVEANNNDVFNCSKALYRDFSTTHLDGVCTPTGNFGIPPGLCTIQLVPPFSGNVSVDPQFDDQAGGDWHLTSNTPTDVTQGGLDGESKGWGFTTDKDGNTRTPPWSMGAYEYDQ